MEWDSKLEEIESRRREKSKAAAPGRKAARPAPKTGEPSPPPASGRRRQKSREIPEAVARLGKTSDKIRALALEGWNVGDIYPALGISYQHAYSVFNRPVKDYAPPKRKRSR